MQSAAEFQCLGLGHRRINLSHLLDITQIYKKLLNS